MAYNEEANIGRMMEAVLSQRLRQVEIAEIIVVASGCTDRTEEIVRAFADTIPDPDAIECLVAPFSDPQVGMTGGRPVPTNDDHTFMGYAAQLLWTLHHQVSLRHPKMGELVAFRNFFRQIPSDSAVDEASIEPLIRGQGLQLRYVPEAVVHNRGPETAQDFLRQRRRIYAGHVYVRDTLGYRVSTMKGIRVLPLLLAAPGVRRDWRYFLWVPAVIALEVWSRFLGMTDYRVWKRQHAVWEMVETTKTITVPSLGSPSSGS